MHVLVVGEALIDVIGGQEYVGGSPLNTAMALARLGRDTRFATCIGDDERGAAIRAKLKAEGIHFANDPIGSKATSEAIARVAPDGSASYDITLDWQPHAIDQRVLADTAVLHIGSLAALVEPGCTLVGRVVEALKGTAWITYDLNLRPDVTGTRSDIVLKIEALAGSCSLVKASDQDLKALYPQRTVEEAAHHLLALGPRSVVVTRGPKGSTWYGRLFTVPIFAPPVDVVDSIAAGDTFSAGLIDALWDLDVFATNRSLTLEEIQRALAHATAAANITVTREGADPPYREELPEPQI